MDGGPDGRETQPHPCNSEAQGNLTPCTASPWPLPSSGRARDGEGEKNTGCPDTVFLRGEVERDTLQPAPTTNPVLAFSTAMSTETGAGLNAEKEFKTRTGKAGTETTHIMAVIVTACGTALVKPRFDTHNSAGDRRGAHP